MCVIFRRITCRGHVGTLASIYGVGGWSRYIRSDRVEYLVLLCPSTPPRFHLCPSFSSTRPPPPLSLRFASPFSHYLLAYAFSSASLSLSLYAHSLSLRCVRSSRAGREREEDPFRSSFRGSSPSRDKGWLLQNVRGWKKLIERAERSRERERKGERGGKWEKKPRE